MRLKLLAIPAFLFIITCRANAELITVCASGCDQTSLAAAKTACAACTIRISDNSITNESIVINGNTVLRIEGSNENITWTNAGANTSAVSITAGLTQNFTLANITQVCTDATDRQNLVWNGLGVGSSVLLENVNFINQETSTGAIGINVVLSSANQLIINKCFLNCSGNTSTTGCFAASGLFVTASSMSLRNSIILGNGGASTRGFRINTAVSATTVADVYNCIIKGFNIGYLVACVTTAKNCLVLGNTTDFSLTAPATGADFTYCAFSQSLASPGTGCVTVTAARTYVNTGGSTLFDMRQSPASLAKYAGNPITGVTDGADIFGNLYNSVTPSIGAIQYYCPSGMGYGCQ